MSPDSPVRIPDKPLGDAMWGVAARTVGRFVDTSVHRSVNKLVRKEVSMAMSRGVESPMWVAAWTTMQHPHVPQDAESRRHRTGEGSP